MPRFLIVRSFSVDEREMPRVGRRSRQLIEEHFPAITWEHSHVVVDDTGHVRTYCVYGAPSEQVALEHASMLGEHTVDEIHELAGDVTPDDFPG